MEEENDPSPGPLAPKLLVEPSPRLTTRSIALKLSIYEPTHATSYPPQGSTAAAHATQSPEAATAATEASYPPGAAAAHATHLLREAATSATRGKYVAAYVDAVWRGMCGARAAASRPMQPALRTNLSWTPCGAAPRRWDAVRAIELLANGTLAIIGDSLGLYMFCAHHPIHAALYTCSPITTLRKPQSWMSLI